jgi:hypothetical protein
MNDQLIKDGSFLTSGDEYENDSEIKKPSLKTNFQTYYLND